MTDDLEWATPVDDPSRPERPPKSCRHQWFHHLPREHPEDEYIVCIRCGKQRDEAAARRGRNNKSRGQRIQKARIEALGGENILGNKPNHDGRGIAFGYESKSGPSYWPTRLARALYGIPVTAGQTAVLIVTETPGPGRRARSVVVVDYSEWKLLHGE